MTRRWWWHAAKKDAGALFHTWAWSLVVMAAGLVAFGPLGGFFGYAIGATLMGALVIGHEFSHRTMPLLLVLPISRTRVLAVKLAVLTIMLAPLAGLAWISGLTSTVLPLGGPAGRTMAGPIIVALPLVCGIGLAPCLTLLSRSALGGAAFAGGIVSSLWFFGEIMGLYRYGLGEGTLPQVEAFRALVTWRGSLSAGAAGIVISWLAFRRWQAVDGVTPGISPVTPGSSRAGERETRRRSWLVCALRKELRLQSLLPIITLFYVLGWYAVARTRPFLEVTVIYVPLSVLSAIYAGTVAVLAGAFGSAEERHLGTASFQQLLPVAASRQWMVKLLVVVGVTVILGLGLPLFLQSITASLRQDDVIEGAEWILLPGIAIVSLYVSSLSTSGLRALVTSIGMLAVLGLAAGLLHSMEVAISWSTEAWFRGRLWGPADARRFAQFPDWLTLIAGVVLAGALVRYAMVNHLGADRRWRAIRRQFAVLAAVAVCSTVVVGLLHAAERANNQLYYRHNSQDGVRVTGRTEFDGAPETDGRARRVCVELLSLAAGGPANEARQTTAQGMSNGDGRFATTYTRPDSYLFRVCEVPAGWSVRSITSNGRDLFENPIVIHADLDDVVVTLTDHPGTIEGDVRAAANTPATDVDVLLFSGFSSQWTDYGPASRRVGITSVKHGRFELPMPRDGTYYLIAVPYAEIEIVRDRRAGPGPRLVGYAIHRPGYVPIQDSPLWFFNDPAPLFTKLAPLADRVHAREGETISHTLRVRSAR